MVDGIPARMNISSDVGSSLITNGLSTKENDVTTIFKYELELTDSQKVKGPGLIPLSVGVQHGLPMLWATVDDDEEDSEYEIIIYGTGNLWTHNLDDLQLIGRIQLHDDHLIWHIFAVVGG